MVTASRPATMGLIRDLLDGGTLSGLPDACLLERFLGARDEAAFAALVTRHGGMVWNTCRAVLKDSNAVDDAFQATFVLLFRKAGTIQGRDALGCWLHRVAYRVAVEAASANARRERVETLAATSRRDQGLPFDDLAAILHEEIERLPERLRLPVVLCDLEGLSRDQASEQLGLTEGSVRGRLAKGRELLKQRLTRRGIKPALPILAAGAIPESLVASTARVASGSGITVTVEALIQAFSRGSTLARVKVASAALMAIGSISVGMVAFGNLPKPPAQTVAVNPRVAPATGPAPARVVPDDPKSAIIEGRILDLEGRPVAGATIRLDISSRPPNGDFDNWVDEIKRLNKPGVGGRLAPFGAGRDHPSTTTGPDGRFRLEGVPRDGITTLTLKGPGIETAVLPILTREMEPIRVKDPQSRDGRFSVYYGLKFDHAAAPSRAIVGTVRDKDTGAPIAGVEITGMPNIPNSSIITPGVETISDAQGHFEVKGLPTSQGFKLFTQAKAGQPYVNYGFASTSNDPKGGPIPFDLNLKRCVLVRGRLTDKATGRGVRGSLEYFAFHDNAQVDEFPNFKRGAQLTRVMTDSSGRYEIPALPGHGLIAARAQEERYLHGIGSQGIAGFEKELESFQTYPYYCPTSDKHVFAQINPFPGIDELTVDLQVDPGQKVRGTVVGPDGQPITDGVEIQTLDVFQSEIEMNNEEVFEVTGLPLGPYRLDFFHKKRKLAGSIRLTGAEKDEVVVKLQPWGTVIGRVVDENGKPRTDVELFSTTRSQFDPERGDLRYKSTVDAQGRFRIEGLVPGVKYDALGNAPRKADGPILDGVQVGPGEVKDLGDIPLPTYVEKKKG